MLFSTGRSSNTRPGAMFAVGRESLACPNDEGERKPLHSCREISFAPASNQAVRPAEHSGRWFLPTPPVYYGALGSNTSQKPTQAIRRVLSACPRNEKGSRRRRRSAIRARVCAGFRKESGGPAGRARAPSTGTGGRSRRRT